MPLPFPDYWDNFPPTYPTLEPKTICSSKNANNKFNRKWILTSKDQEQNYILNEQSNCIDYINNQFLSLSNDLGISIGDLPDLDGKMYKKPEGKDLYPSCFQSAADNFPVINTYCRKNDNSLISPVDLHNVCLNRGKIDNIMCVNPNTYQFENQNLPEINFRQNKNAGLYLCSDSGNLSHSPCHFNKLEMESNLNKGFQKTYCPIFTTNDKELQECTDKGWFINPKNNTIYVNRGNVMFGVNPQKIKENLQTKTVDKSDEQQASSSQDNIDSSSPIHQFYSLPPPSRNPDDLDHGNRDLPTSGDRETLPDMQGKDTLCSIM